LTPVSYLDESKEVRVIRRWERTYQSTISKPMGKRGLEGGGKPLSFRQKESEGQRRNGSRKTDGAYLIREKRSMINGRERRLRERHSSKRDLYTYGDDVIRDVKRGRNTKNTTG